jgi:hypothetical protein
MLLFNQIFRPHSFLYLNRYICLIRNLADIDGDGRLTKDEFCVAMHYVGVAKTGKPLPSTLPPEVVPPACRKPAANVAQPGSNPAPVAEKPVSLPRPTSKPPSDATRVPAIQPPTVAAARRPPATGGAPPAAAAPSKPPAVDPFGMDPLAFDAVAPLLDAPLVPFVSGVSPTEAVAKEISSQVKEHTVEAVAVTSPEDASKVSAVAANAEPRVLSPPTATTAGNGLYAYL